jgi:hypothetical protein
VQQILLSILPLAIGLLLLGLLLYSNSLSTYGNLPNTFLSLFAVMNCDSIYFNYVSLTTNTETTSWLSSLYLTLTFLLFNTLLLRLILAVVESLYFYLRLYSESQKKRLVLRKRELIRLMRDRFGGEGERDREPESETESESKLQSRPGGRLREDSSEAIQRSLLHIYAKSLSTST